MSEQTTSRSRLLAFFAGAILLAVLLTHCADDSGNSSPQKPAAVTPTTTSTTLPVLTPRSGRGYWLVSADGGVYCYGDAKFFGSLSGRVLNAKIVGLVPTPDGYGYWLVAADGGVFAFGDASYFGSPPKSQTHLNTSIVGGAVSS